MVQLFRNVQLCLLKCHFAVLEPLQKPTMFQIIVIPYSALAETGFRQ